MPYGIYSTGSYPPTGGAYPISVGDAGGVRSVDYGKCSAPTARNYSINYELGRSPSTPNSSFTVLANSSSNMNPAPPTLATAKITPGPLGVNGYYISYWFNKRGRTQGFNFSVGFTGTSYSKYNVDLCTGKAIASASSNPYVGLVAQNFTINVNGQVANGVNTASLTQTSRCASAGTTWSVTENESDCTFNGNTDASWLYNDISKFPV
jgi:hypothetical protein